MTELELKEKIAAAAAWYERLEPDEKAKHDYAQRRSFVRGMCPSRIEFGEWCKIVDRMLPPLTSGKQNDV